MIVTENLTIDGRQFVKTHSDAGMKIQRQDGVIFDDATDPINSGRTYTETDITIEGGDTAEEIVEILLGGET